MPLGKLIEFILHLTNFAIQVSHFNVSLNNSIKTQNNLRLHYSQTLIDALCISISLYIRVHQNFFSSQSSNKGNRKLPFDMGFKNIETFSKKFNVSCSHQRAEVTENRD